MPPKELTKRYALFVVSLFFSALGVAVTKCGELGVSPISSVANVLSIKFDLLSLGNWLIIWNAALILGQIALLRKKFQWIQLLQQLLSFVFGWFTDICMMIVAPFKTEFYPVRLVMIIVGTVILGFGITLSIIANVIMNSGEAFVKALSDTIHKDFSVVKIFFDVGCVVTAVILSLLFFDLTIVGTREGTIISALCTGFVVRLFIRPLAKPLNKLLSR